MGIRVLADRYELLDEIGRGGMAIVWRARDRRLDRVVAVKIPRSESLDDVMVRRVEREARLAAGISHPNVVTVYDSGIVDGEPYVVMELVDGRPLSASIGRLDATEARQTAVELADGLAAIHAAGVIHRDIKPGNVVMLDAVPKLTDFGIARRDESDRLTEPQQIMGTPSYLAPEVLAGSPATPASDVYSLGVLVAEMITGHRPTARGTEIDTGDPALDELLAAALTADPRVRPTAAEFAAALRSGRLSTIPIPLGTVDAGERRMASAPDSFASTRPLEAGPDVARNERRQRGVWMAATVVAAAIIGVYAWMSDGATDPGGPIPHADTTVTTAVTTVPASAAAPSTTSSTVPPTTSEPILVSTPEQAAADLTAWAMQIPPNELKPRDRRELVSQVDKVLEAHRNGDDDKLEKPFGKLMNLIGGVDSGREDGLDLLAVLAESVGFDIADVS